MFDLQGKYITEWAGLHRPCATKSGPNDIAFVSELDHRLSIWDRETGQRVGGWGDEKESNDAGLFIGSHGDTIASRSMIYVGEVAETIRGMDRGFRSVQKFVPA